MMRFATPLAALGLITCLQAQDSFAPGSVDVREAIENIPHRLSPTWGGNLSLVIPDEATQTKEVTFTHFIRDASGHSDPDCPRPHKPAIFHGASLDHGQYSVGDVAIFDTLDLDWIRSWKTFEDVLMTVPDVIRASDEENQSEEIGYWYNTFAVSKDSNEMDVLFLSFTGPADRGKKDFKIKDVKVWAGTLKPK